MIISEVARLDLPTSPIITSQTNSVACYGHTQPLQLACVLVGLVPFFSALVQPLMIPIFKKHPFLKLQLIFDVVNIMGNVLYAVGYVADSFVIVLFGRALSGTVGSPTFGSTYIVFKYYDRPARKKVVGARDAKILLKRDKLCCNSRLYVYSWMTSALSFKSLLADSLGLITLS